MPARAIAMMVGVCGMAAWVPGVAWAQTCTNETFAGYADGALNGQGAWTGSATAAEIAVESNTVKVKSTLSGTIVNAALPVNCQACEDGIITVSFKILGDPAGDNSTLWGIYFDDANGLNLARFFRGSMSVAGRTDGLSVGYLTNTNALNGTTYDECKAVIDTRNNITTYYLNNVLMAVSPPNFVNPVSHGVDGHNQQVVGNSIGRILIERQATATATGTITIDDIQITSCSGTCSASVTPIDTQTAYAKAGEPASPANVVYTFTNTNQDSLNYTVAETLADGTTANDYGWLSLDKAGGANSLTTGQTDTVTATFNTTGLAAGVYVGYVTFTDTCDPARRYTRSVKLLIEDCLADDFSRPNGPLYDAPGWSGPPLGITHPIQIVNGEVKINGGYYGPLGDTAAPVVNPMATHSVATACPACSVNGGLISVKIKTKGGQGTSTIWRMYIYDSAGREFGSWYGTGTTARGRLDLPGGTVITDTVTLSTSSFDVLEARINPDDTRTIAGIPANSILFLVNGVAVTTAGTEPPTPHFNPIPYGTNGTGDAVARVDLTRQNNAGTDSDFILFDDLSVGRCTEQCNDPVFDVRDTTNAVAQDGKVTVHDFNVFQSQCATGATPGAGVFDALPFECRCMDVDGDQAVDINDFGWFQRCYTGLAGTVDPNCDN